MLKDFRDFLLRGNVVDLAVAVVLGAAFGAVVTALVGGLITPLIAALFGQPNLDTVGVFTINDAEFKIGIVLTAVVNFVLIATAIFFIIVLPMKRLREFQDRKKVVDEVAAVPTELELLIEIRDLLAAGKAR